MSETFEVHGKKIEQTIYLIRGRRVMLSTDLARLYGVETKALIQAVKRNIKRFPSDFMFALEPQEVECLRSQFVTLDKRPTTYNGGLRDRHIVAVDCPDCLVRCNPQILSTSLQ